MSNSDSIRPLDRGYTHSPPMLELQPAPKKHKKPALPAQPVAIPSPQQQQHPLEPPHKTLLHSCPPPLTYSSSSSAVLPLYSLPEFEVGSLPHQLPPVWPLQMINEFLTPPTNRSLSLSEPSSYDDVDDNGEPLLFDMDDIQ